MKLSDIYFVSKLIEGLRPERERFIAMVGEGRKKMVNKVEKQREAKATTLRRVRLARSCAMGGTDVAGEVKGVDEVGVRVACGGARSS